jgi:hypothetical protein
MTFVSNVCLHREEVNLSGRSDPKERHEWSERKGTD